MEREETGTLAELNVKAGDVVSYGGSYTYEVRDGCKLKSHSSGDVIDYASMWKTAASFKIISRATPKPRTWGELTDAEKGALLLAMHEGKVIQCYQWSSEDWQGGEWRFHEDSAYRIKPESVRETVDVTANGATIGTIETLDGIPQPDTIKLTAV
jgi:hypothetical protein